MKFSDLKYGLICLIACLGILHAEAQVDAPSLRCLAVNPSGDVTLGWVLPPDPNNQFFSYDIYYSNGGPYMLLISLNTYAQNSYTHVGANAELNGLSYYIITEYNGGSGSSSPSDTLNTISLILNNGTQGIAKLNWNHLHQPNLSTSLAWYYIYKKRGVGGVWTLLDSVNSNAVNYTDTLNECLCSDSIFYRIEIGDSSGCNSVSTWSSELFEDNTPPDIPEIDSISVDMTNGHVMIAWEQSTNCDTQGYIITYNDNGNWIILDTIWGAGNTFYIDTQANANTTSEQYGVAAFDSCWSGTPLSPNTSATGLIHKTVFLQGSMDQCNRQIKLTWNKYEQWVNGVSAYNLYVSANGGPWQLLSSNTASVTSFTHADLTPYTTYCYMVRSVESSGQKTSTSNKLCITMYVPQLPGVHYLKNVSVLDSNSVELSLYTDISADILYYNIQRADSSDGEFNIIGQVFPGTSNIINYTDNNANPDEGSRYYRVAAVDVCGREAVYTNVSHTIYLHGNVNNSAMMDSIYWNAYEDWDVFGNGISYYTLYRGDDIMDFNSSPLINLPATDNVYIDHVIDEYEQNGRFCYYIRATEAEGNIYGFKEKSNSNTICLTVEPKIFIPNSFTPNGDGTNDYFNPIGSFVDRSDYYFTVYNRWGELVFIATDVGKGWDGTYLDAPAAEGVYVYHVVFTDANGEKLRFRGAVTLIR